MTWAFVEQATLIATAIIVLSKACDYGLDYIQKCRSRQSENVDGA